MSIHPSLKISDQDNKQRSVLKRIERIKLMKDKEQWKEGDEVFGLPKIKTLRIKIKKEKVEKAETTTTAAAPGAASAAAPAKEQASSKAPAAKAQEKK